MGFSLFRSSLPLTLLRVIKILGVFLLVIFIRKHWCPVY